MSISDVIAALLAAALLHLRGVRGKAGWRWLFLIEVCHSIITSPTFRTDMAQALLTLVIGIASFLLMPASPTQTASKFRGKEGWFNERQVLVQEPSLSF